MGLSGVVTPKQGLGMDNPIAEKSSTLGVGLGSPRVCLKLDGARLGMGLIGRARLGVAGTPRLGVLLMGEGL
ncbi:hypothetical protein PIB30_090281, partial [Stylosanthes scabra]|nr:hypothetical protein [Stylosanthes scabra]